MLSASRYFTATVNSAFPVLGFKPGPVFASPFIDFRITIFSDFVYRIIIIIKSTKEFIGDRIIVNILFKLNQPHKTIMHTTSIIKI